MKSALVAALCLVAMPASAASPTREFKAEFERMFRPKQTYAVVVQSGVPTTSVYGVDGKSSSTAHYSIDVVGGQWKTAQGLLDFDQTAADFLIKGELMELASISYKDDRVDLRMVSLEAHKVTRGGLIKSTHREPVATNFKFFFPFAVSLPADVPKAVEYIAQYLRPFSSEQEARAFAARVAGGSEERRSTSGATSRTTTTTTTKKEIKVGMTSLEVIEILGKPEKEVSFESKTRWTYPDLTVLFENGRVKEVKF